MSKLEVDAIEPQSGTTLTLGASGDSVNIASGATITDFTSTGIDDNATSTAITIDSSENVGIKTTSPKGDGLSIGTTDATAFISPGGSNNSLTLTTTGSGGVMRFYTKSGSDGNRATTESMRIDTSGVLLIGKTTTGSSATTDGVLANPVGLIVSTRTDNTPLVAARQGTEGDIIQIYKDGTKVGAIGHLNDFVIHSTVASHSGLRFSTNSILPTNNSGIDVNDTIDLGNLTRKFDDIYATNGTIQTSDQNEKQSIQSLTTAEMNVAKRLSPLIKTFKWNSAVEEKGDSARTHTGIIAQDIQQAFTDEGLDAGNYALFISSTWWEKEISVDAVQAQEAVYETQTDEEGNEIQVLVQEAVEGKDAYTYMDIKEEATEGYTERTRLGVRYPELLSFIQAYNDQRFTTLEARITALENA